MNPALQLTIIGLGQIGASIGLALQKHSERLRRVGHDKVFAVAQRAHKIGAVDKIHPNLHSAVEGADILLLALPLDEVRPTLELIKDDLHPGCVLMETAPVKRAVIQWVKELLPAGCHYIGLAPALNPAYLLAQESGQQAAHADLFQGAPMFILSPPREWEERHRGRSDDDADHAIELAADLTQLIGAQPLFADVAECDSLMAAVDTLPRLLACALVNSTIDQPGWQEGGKLSGRTYAQATTMLATTSSDEKEGAATLEATVRFNRDNVLRLLDGYLVELQSLYQEIAQSNVDQHSLSEWLQRAFEKRQKWWKGRTSANWASGPHNTAIEIPRYSILSQLFGVPRERFRKQNGHSGKQER